MKIATFNINNVNKRLPNLLSWLATSQPDVVCLQELKSADAAFPAEALRAAGYESVWRGERSWNGVAILARGGNPILIRDRLPGDDRDKQSRYIEAAVDGIVIASIYLPNGNPQPGPKFTYKLDWFDRLLEHAASLLHQDVPVVLAGDYNVAPDRLRHLRDAILQGQRFTAASAARGLCATYRYGLDRRASRAAPKRADVHLLELSPRRLATRRRTSS